MSSTTDVSLARATDVRVGRERLVVTLSDGRTIAAPLAWFPRLAAANRRARQAWRLIGDGVGIRWDDLDEDISVEGLLRA